MNNELIERIEARSVKEHTSRSECADVELMKLLQDCKSKIENLIESSEMMNNCIHDLVVGNQAAWIEWQHGKGADAAMGWIHNGLLGPGHIPDEDEPYGKESQAWYDANRSKPFPQCPCGRPSHIMWMGKGFCCDDHYQEAKRAASNE